MLILAFDTSTPAVTVAVLRGMDIIGERQNVDARRHGEVLAPSIDGALHDAAVSLRDIDVVAVGNGPGPFTGLRVGLVTARTLAHGLGVPAYGVCSLDALAAAVGDDEELFVATDARRREVYWATYRNGARTRGPEVTRPLEIPAITGRRVGHGVHLYPDALGPLDGSAPLYPPAAWVGRLVGSALDRGETPAGVAPMYLRRPDAAEPRPPKSVLPAGPAPSA